MDLASPTHVQHQNFSYKILHSSQIRNIHNPTVLFQLKYGWFCLGYCVNTSSNIVEFVFLPKDNDICKVSCSFPRAGDQMIQQSPHQIR
ncbi:unnamed protein product [Ilex paraguariensis]|uniref:Uncharacterized protein n=1 Tax=Ilex paraguariensis TaxID=185542 RepID=A0ABC8U0G8_9AQUA